MSYTEAWAQWLAGADLRSAELWGVSILWWGRFGKILQLVVAMLGAIELIGARRLEHFATLLRGKYFDQLLGASVLAAACAAAWHYAPLWDQIRAADPNWRWRVDWQALWIPLAVNLFGVTVVVLVSLVAKYSSSAHVHAYCRLLLLLLFIVGFHFDLLAS